MRSHVAFAIMSLLAENGIQARHCDADAIGIAPQPAPKVLTEHDKQRIEAAEAKRRRKAAKRKDKR